MFDCRALASWFLLTLLLMYTAIAGAHATTATKQAADTPIPDEALVSKHYKLPHFNAVNVTGPARVQIITCNPETYSMSFLADSDTLAMTQVQINKGILLITRQPSRSRKIVPKTLLITIRVPSLQRLVLKGSVGVATTPLDCPLSMVINPNSSVNFQGNNTDLRYLSINGPANATFCGINSCGLTLQKTGFAQIHFEGMAALQNLTSSGPGSISLYWIDSPCLNLFANGGRLFLAGRTGTLTATLSDHTYLDATNLRAQRAYVHTCRCACANVWVKDSLSTWAADSSTIFYFNDPAFVNKYMVPPGSVLRMSGINPSCGYGP